MDLGLKGKVAIVTGSSHGIGRAIALGLAEEGCSLAICSRQEDRLLSVASEIEGLGAQVLSVVGDLSQQIAVETLVNRTMERYGRVDVLINNVGGTRGGYEVKPSETSDNQMAETLAVNVYATLWATRMAVPHMKLQGSGAIVNIASVWGRETGGTLAYNAAKAAVISMTKQLARELAPHGIRVNSVAPGSVHIPGGWWERKRLADPQFVADFVSRELPMGRFGSTEEIASVVVFLVSEKASLVSGACVVVDGAQSRTNF